MKKGAAELTSMLSHTTEALAVVQGIEVGFFDLIPDTKPATLQELSGRSGYDLRMVERWLRFAVAAGYVHAAPAGYTLSAKGSLLKSESVLPDLLGLHHLAGYFMNVLPYSKDAYRSGVAFDSITRSAISKDFLPRVASRLSKTLVEFFARAGLSDGQSILDLGCGSGSLLRELANALPGVSGIGMDINPYALEMGRTENRLAGLQDQIELQESDITDLTVLPDHAFDWVSAVNLLQFLPTGHQEKLLREMLRIARCGIFFTQAITDSPGACAGDALFSTLFSDFTGFFTKDQADALVQKLGTGPYASLPVFQGGARLIIIPTTGDAALIERILRLNALLADAWPQADALPETPRVLPDRNDAVPAQEHPDTRQNHRPAHSQDLQEETRRNLELQGAENAEKLARAYERLRQANQGLERAGRELESIHRKQSELDRIKSDFVSVVSHELRTPLTSIKAYAEIILMKPDMPSEKRTRLLQVIDTESDRLSRLINDVLDLTKIESGKLSWRITQLSIDDIVETAVSGIRSLVDNKGLALSARMQPGMPFLFGDRDRLIQVLNNVLSNAIKFTPQGGSITIAARCEEGPKPRIEVSISDTGIGIQNEELELIFDKFHCSGDVLAGQTGGTGLGLSISRQIVEFHGGTIRAQSTPGEGSTFTICLPLNKQWKQEGRNTPEDNELMPGPA